MSDETPTGVITELTATPPANVLQLVKREPGSRLPEDTADELRKLADAVDRGEVSAMVIGIEWADEYETRLMSSLVQTSVLVQLLQMRWADMMRGFD